MFDTIASLFDSLVGLKSWRASLWSGRGKWGGTAVSDSYFPGVMPTQLWVKQLCRGWGLRAGELWLQINFKSDPRTTGSVFKLVDLLAVSSCHC